MSSGTYPAASGDSNGGGAFWPRPRGRFLISACVVAVGVVVAVAALLLSGGGNAAARHATTNHKYGGYPSWLRHTKLPSVNTILRATEAHPQLEAVEGNTVQATLPGGAEADVTAVGPTFPAWVSASVQAGTLSNGAAVPATFTVTVIAQRGNIPLRASAFSILTAGGQLVHPAVSGPGGTLPAVLRAGQHVNLTVRAKLAEGDGSLRWAPHGSRVLSGWLYQLELD